MAHLASFATHLTNPDFEAAFVFIAGFILGGAVAITLRPIKG